MDEINIYRVENCLNEIKWSNTAYNVAKNQAEYCSLIFDVKHDQTDSFVEKVYNFKIEPDFDKRFENGGVKTNHTDFTTIAENLVKIPTGKKQEDIDIKHVACMVIDAWKNSPGHNEGMLIPTLEFAGISNITVTDHQKFYINVITDEEGYITTTGVTYFVAFDAYR